MSSTRTQLQTDAEARLIADPYFADVAIILQRKGVTEKEIQQRLSVRNARSGKIGACVLVLIPGADVVDPNLPGPRLGLVQSFVVLVHPTINDGDLGTGKDPEDIAEKLLQLFHHARLSGGAVLTGGANAIVPNDSFDGLIGQQVNLNTFGGPAAPSKVGTPTIAADNSNTSPCTVTMACGTVGAVIWYTTDGSYPSSENPLALVYSAPFTQPTGATIRAAAQLSGSQQSDVAQLTIAAGASGSASPLGGEGGEAVGGEGGETLNSEG